MDISRSVVWKVTELSSALTRMPLRMGSVLLEDMPFDTELRTSMSSSLAMLNLIVLAPICPGWLLLFLVSSYIYI